MSAKSSAIGSEKSLGPTGRESAFASVLDSCFAGIGEVIGRIEARILLFRELGTIYVHALNITFSVQTTIKP